MPILTLEDIYNPYINYFNEYGGSLDKNKIIDTFIEMYDISKSKNGEFNYEDIARKVFETSWYAPCKYILDTHSSYDKDAHKIILNPNFSSFSGIEELLDFISLTTKNVIANNCLENNKNHNINNISFTNTCAFISNIVSRICAPLGIKCNTIRIDYGFDASLNLLGGHGYHYFNILYIGNERYIIDLAYREFYDIRFNLLEQMGIQGLQGPRAGIYMAMNDRRKALAQKILRDGWFKLDEQNMKDYFDGFALSYRNASYYDDLGYIDFETNYTADDYETMVFGDDNQANHEDIENLGIQRKLLRNKLEFKTDISKIDL